MSDWLRAGIALVAHDGHPWAVYDLEAFFVQIGCMLHLCSSLRVHAQESLKVEELLKYQRIVQREPWRCNHFLKYTA